MRPDGRKRVACFFTAGFTEMNSMKAFVKKINPDAEYIQLCPTGPRKSAQLIKTRDLASINQNINGLTGNDLIEYVLEAIAKPRFRDEKYDAILIEDDKDSRFLRATQDGSSEINSEAWITFREDLCNKIHAEYPDITVILLMAAPEAEAWFISDWANSFGSVYHDMLGTARNNLFSVRFRILVRDEILTDTYTGRIESYGYFDGSYAKLSQKIQDAILKEDSFADTAEIRYSKRLQGASMLFNIQPDTVLKSCNYFFREGYTALKNL